MPWAKGQSGNPGGRKKLAGDLRELAQSKAPAMLQILIDIAENEEVTPKARTTAASHVLDRAYGKPAQTLGDGDGNPVDWVDILKAAQRRAADV